MHLLDALHRLDPIAARQHGVFSRHQAREAGLHRTQLARLLDHRLVRAVAPGVFALSSAPTSWYQRLSVATVAGTGRGAIDSAAALALHEVDGFRPGRPEVLVPRGTSLRLPGYTVRSSTEFDDIDLTTVAGIRCTTVVRALADAANRVGARRVLQGLDDVRRRGCTLDEVEAVARRLHRPGQRGTGVLLRLVEESADGGVAPDSWFERLLEECLRSPKLPPLVRQYPIVSSRDGRVLARVDLAIPPLRLGIEAHSRRYHFGALTEKGDEHRDLAVAEEGWHLLYLGWHTQLRPAVARRRIERAVAARTRLLGME